MTNCERSGILAAGNFIVDRIKCIDAYPPENMLATIRSEQRSNGGGPYNVLKDLAALGAGYPLIAAGRTGADADGQWIRDDCAAHGIETALLTADDGHPTSYTDVMTVQGTGRRTFFHHRGANAHFAGENICFTKCSARIFHLAYLMLLDELDHIDSTGRTRASQLLERASQAGMRTSIDIVSTPNPHFSAIVFSALPFTDHLLINEIEAGRALGREVPAADPTCLIHAANDLLQAGVRHTVALHTEFGAVTVGRNGAVCARGAVLLPQDEMKGANGAGDAFAAGYLHALHQGLSNEMQLELACCTAATCLRDPSPSAGILPAEECLQQGRIRGFGKFEPASIG
jgi:sugar/nucleoside kinase (ribokinase family)